MKLFIPTYRRVEKQRTWDNLPNFAKEFTYLVCGEDEREDHEKAGRQVWVHPEGFHRVAPKRQWIVENSSDSKIVMADDDLSFRCREEGDYKLRPMEEDDFRKMFDTLEEELDNYAAVGVSSQAGNNHTFPATILSPGRMFTMYALRADILLREQIRFDDLEVMEDFHVALSLLRKGLPNAILQSWCWSQAKSNAAGGCSTYRTAEVQDKNARKLAELHAPFVTVVEKESKSWGNGLEKRTDVRVQWKKALESAND
jgi:hypothetical protein